MGLAMGFTQKQWDEIRQIVIGDTPDEMAYKFARNIYHALGFDIKVDASGPIPTNEPGNAEFVVMSKAILHTAMNVALKLSKGEKR